MKKKIFIVLILFIAGIFLFTQEEEQSNKPEFGLLLENITGYISNSKFLGHDIYDKFKIYGSVLFPIKKYSLKLYMSNILSNNWNIYNEEYLTPNNHKKINTYTDIAYGNYDLNNELSFGLENIIKIPNSVNITLGYQQMFYLTTYSTPFLKFKPYLQLSGYYAFGFFWKNENIFYFYYDPYQGKGNELSEFEYDNFSVIKIDILKYFVRNLNSNYNLSIYIENDLKLYYYYRKNIISSYRDISDEIYFGLDYFFYSCKPYLYLYLTPKQFTYYDKSKSELFNNGLLIGIKAGFELDKAWFTLLFDYWGYKEVLSDNLWKNKFELTFRFDI